MNIEAYYWLLYFGDFYNLFTPEITVNFCVLNETDAMILTPRIRSVWLFLGKNIGIFSNKKRTRCYNDLLLRCCWCTDSWQKYAVRVPCKTIFRIWTTVSETLCNEDHEHKEPISKGHNPSHKVHYSLWHHCCLPIHEQMYAGYLRSRVTQKVLLVLRDDRADDTQCWVITMSRAGNIATTKTLFHPAIIQEHVVASRTMRHSLNCAWSSEAHSRHKTSL